MEDNKHPHAQKWQAFKEGTHQGAEADLPWGETMVWLIEQVKALQSQVDELKKKR